MRKEPHTEYILFRSYTYLSTRPSYNGYVLIPSLERFIPSVVASLERDMYMYIPGIYVICISAISSHEITPQSKVK